MHDALAWPPRAQVGMRGARRRSTATDARRRAQEDRAAGFAGRRRPPTALAGPLASAPCLRVAFFGTRRKGKLDDDEQRSREEIENQAEAGEGRREQERRRRSCGQGRGVDEDGAGGGREEKLDADGQRRREEIENKAGEEDQAAKTETSHSIRKAEGQRG